MKKFVAISGSLRVASHNWLVGSYEFPGKPVARINTSPRATHALAALTLTLETMSANLINDASITLPLLGTVNDAESIAANPEFAGRLSAALERFVRTIQLQADAST
jgi:chromate reductase, NAD(P)H dehydrogenase (quinone)